LTEKKGKKRNRQPDLPRFLLTCAFGKSEKERGKKKRKVHPRLTIITFFAIIKRPGSGGGGRRVEERNRGFFFPLSPARPLK